MADKSRSKNLEGGMESRESNMEEKDGEDDETVYTNFNLKRVTVRLTDVCLHPPHSPTRKKLLSVRSDNTDSNVEDSSSKDSSVSYLNEKPTSYKKLKKKQIKKESCKKCPPPVDEFVEKIKEVLNVDVMEEKKKDDVMEEKKDLKVDDMEVKDNFSEGESASDIPAPGSILMMKFVDDSGQDITDAVRGRTQSPDKKKLVNYETSDTDDVKIVDTTMDSVNTSKDDSYHTCSSATNVTIESQMKEDFGIISEEEEPSDDDKGEECEEILNQSDMPKPIRESPSFLGKTDVELETVCEPKSSPSVEEPANKSDEKIPESTDFTNICILEKVELADPVVTTEVSEDDADVTIVDDHDYGFRSPGRGGEKERTAQDLLSGVGVKGPNVEVMASNSLQLEEVINRFAEGKNKTTDSEFESDIPDKESIAGDVALGDIDFSADDEKEESGCEMVTNSSVWSSLSLILENTGSSDPSPSKMKKKRTRRKSSPTTSSTKKSKTPSPTETCSSSGRKYRRSSKMSSLLESATDTDDQSPVRNTRVVSRLSFKQVEKEATTPVIKEAVADPPEEKMEEKPSPSPGKRGRGRPRKADADLMKPRKDRLSVEVKENKIETEGKENKIETKDEDKDVDNNLKKADEKRKSPVKPARNISGNKSTILERKDLVTLLVCPPTGSDTELDIATKKEKKSNVTEEERSETGFSLGSLVWARVGAHPWWPSLVTQDPELGLHTRDKTSTKGDNLRLWECHVNFFGENNRAWVDERHLKRFKGASKFQKEKEELLANLSIKQSRKFITKSYVPSSGMRDKWDASVKRAETLIKVKSGRRSEQMVEINKELCQELSQKRKRKLAEDSEEDEDGFTSPANKRARVDAMVDSVVKGLKPEEVAECGRNISGYQLYKLAQREPLMREGMSEHLIEEECRERWDELNPLEKRAFKERARLIQAEMEEERGARRSAASQRQMEVKQRKEDKEKEKAEAGPGWYYVVETVKVKKEGEGQVGPEGAVGPRMVGQFVSSRCCAHCEEANGEQVFKCRSCQTNYHASCLGLVGSSEESFRCTRCSTGRQICFICRKHGDEGKIKQEEGVELISPVQPDLGPPRKCSVSGCGKFYHDRCLVPSQGGRLSLWPQTRLSSIGSLTCPAHTCHTCAADNPRDPVMKYTDKLMKCVRCPTAYHSGDHCVTAGTLQLTKLDILCPKHYSPSIKQGSKKGSNSSSHINTNWCFVCSRGGSLICCEVCPASFHLECQDLASTPEGKFYCDDCVNGRMPLYNDIIWVKLGNYRWWPSKVVHPANVPDNIEKLAHKDGEFPIQFLGSKEYYWINHGRSFLYEEGDSERVPNLSNCSNSMVASFRKGLVEAEDMWKERNLAKLDREALAITNGGAKKPPPWIKLKSNKPYGDCEVKTVEVGDLQPCDCNPEKDNPCGEDSNCLNRLLMCECHPGVCRAKEKCRNMRFQKRQYPPVQVLRSEGRGWGLRNLESIKKGQFVIEYVGELITMAEYRNRMNINQKENEENYYYLTIDSNRMIDAGPKGNLARFMNHSCDPNCITQKWTVNGDTRVGLFAIKNIEPASELTFNYQFETIGEEKKKCLCGAVNCSGLIGEKPKNKEKEEQKERRLALQQEKKKKRISKQGKEGLPVKLKWEKSWEDVCFRCHEGGSLVRCDLGQCPKSYHLLCIGKDTMPRSKWHCPWHYCVTCSHLVSSGGAWCRHCPNAYCKAHREVVTTHPELGSLCMEHDEEVDFLLDTVRASPVGVLDLLPSPCPTTEQLAVWRKARGLEPVAVSSSTVTPSDSANTDTESNGGPRRELKRSEQKRSRFSVEPINTSRESTPSLVVDSQSRSGSVSVCASEAESRPETPEVSDQKVKVFKDKKSARKELETYPDPAAEEEMSLGKEESTTVNPIYKPCSPERNPVQSKTIASPSSNQIKPVKRLTSSDDQLTSPAVMSSSPSQKMKTQAKRLESPMTKTISPATPRLESSVSKTSIQAKKILLSDSPILITPAKRISSPAAKMKSSAKSLTSPADQLTSPPLRPVSQNSRLKTPAKRHSSPAGKSKSPASRKASPAEMLRSSPERPSSLNPPSPRDTPTSKRLKSPASRPISPVISSKSPVKNLKSPFFSHTTTPVKSISPAKKLESPAKVDKIPTPNKRQPTPIKLSSKQKTPEKKDLDLAAFDEVQEGSGQRRSRRDGRSLELGFCIGSQSVVCRVLGCVDTRQFSLFDYGKHFSVAHRTNTPIHHLLVENEAGIKYALLDIYKFVYRCQLKDCGMIFFGVNENSKADFLKKVKDHWKRSFRGRKSHYETEGTYEAKYEAIVENWAFVDTYVVPVETTLFPVRTNLLVEPTLGNLEGKENEENTLNVETVENLGNIENSDKTKVRRRTKTPLEGWEVFDFKREEQLVFKCHTPSCSFLGTALPSKMQIHLKYHGLSWPEVLELAATTETMEEKLSQASRVIFRNINNDVVGVGPQLLLPDKEVVPNLDMFLCQAEAECSMSFETEKSLLSHCRLVHPPLKPSPRLLPTSERLELGGTGFQCLTCQQTITCQPGSTNFMSHWALHTPTSLTEMRFVDLTTSQVCTLSDIYPFSAQCGVSSCGWVVTSQESFALVQTNFSSHWAEKHLETFNPPSYSTLSNKRSRSQSPTKPVSTASPRRSLSNTSSRKVANTPVEPETKAPEIPVEKSPLSLDPLELEGPFQCEKCGEELAGATQVFQHSSTSHQQEPLTQLTVLHLASGRGFLNTALFRFVLQCGLFECNKFVGKNSSLEAAIRRLQAHWQKDHPETNLSNFCYSNIGVEHDEHVVPVCKDEFTVEEKDIKNEMGNRTNVPKETCAVDISTYDGPFLCSHHGCEFSCAQATRLGMHWNQKHPTDPSQASCVDQASLTTLSLFHVFRFVAQCLLCKLVRCARDTLNHAVEGMHKHISSCHPEEARTENLSEMYHILQDENGRYFPNEPDVQVDSTEKETNFDLASFALLQSQGMLHNNRVMTPHAGPFQCHICKVDVFQKILLHHYNRNHPGQFPEFLMLDLTSNLLLTIFDLFKCLAVCPKDDCATVMGQNSSYNILRFNMVKHYMKYHNEEPGEDFDFMIVVPPSRFMTVESESDTVDHMMNVVPKYEPPKPKYEPPKPKPLELIKQTTPTPKVEGKQLNVAIFSPDKNNISFSQKGYYGPYHCLREGCGHVCEKYGQTTQKLLLQHWTMEHGRVENLLYLDMPSLTVLNVKVVCNNVGYCTFPSCNSVMHGSRKADYPTAVTNHWKNSHPEESTDMKYTDELCAPVINLPDVTPDSLEKFGRWFNISGVKSVKRKTKDVAETAQTPMRSSTKMSPRKLETAPGKSLVVQEDPLDDTYDHEDSIGYEGPFLCSLCDHRVVLSQASNRAVLNHWVREHGQPTSLVFHDEDSKEQLTVGHFFRTVAKCSRCEYFLGNNRFDADLYRRINKHWVKDHPEEDDEYEERDKLVVIKFKQEGEVDNNVDSDEDSDKVDPNLVYNGPFTCIVDGCKDSVDHTRAGWKMRCLDHFLAAHDHLINELKIKDEGSGRTLKVQHLFQFVGQCSQPDCHMIKGVNGRSAKNGRYEIIRTFRVHYAAQHPGIGENDAEFTMLVDNHNVKFETTGSKKNKAKEIKAKNDVTRDKKSVKYRCNFCDKEFGGVEKLSHWNRCHSHTPISLLAYTNTTTNQNTKAVDLMTSVGQCSLCKEYVGVEDGEDLQSVVRNHYSNTHKKNIKDVKCPDHFSVVFDSHSSVETAANDSEYGLDGFTCGVCSNKSNPDSNLTTMAVITHWNIEHLGSDINKFTLRCIRTGTVGDVFSIFLEVGFCKLKGCGLLIATRSKLRPLRREGKEHLKKYHPNEQLFNEAKHLKRVVKGEKLKSSKSVVKGVKEMKEILNPRHSVDSGQEERGELGLLTCAIEGCGEGEISLYGRHFSMSHKDVPMDQVRVRTDAGTFLSCHDLFNYAVRCSLKNCDFISVTGHSTDKPCLRSLKKHWARDHPDKTGELSYDNIMPPSPNSSPVKDVDQAQKRPLLVKEADPMSPVKKSKSGTQDKRVITTDPGTCYRCSICQKEVELRPGSSPLVHWTKEHSEQPALGLQMVRTSDGTLVNLRAMYRHIFQCQASTPCNYITVARTVDNSDAIKRLRIHWENRHRVDGDCSYRTVGDHLGFHCQAESCTYVLASADQLLEHHKQQHGGTKDMAVRDLETRDRLGVRDIFTWVRECQAAGCGAVFCGNTSEEETEQEAQEHWDQHHKDEDGVPHLPSLEATTAPCGFQCMAGAEDGEVVCATVIPPGNNGNALRHWQYKHPGLRLRDMIFMDHTSGDFLQISDVFKNVLVCSEEGCGVVIYTNFLDRGGKKMSTHWERDHRGVDVKQDVGPFKKLETRNFLDSNFTITHEDFIDFEREDEFENSTADEDINIDDEAEENAAEFTFEELEVIGYKCGVEGCHKVVAVSRFSTTMVALNRLKNHFTKMHRHLNSEQFIYDTQYNHNIDNAVNVNISETDQGRTVLVTPPKAQLPLEASPTTATSSNIVVWKCPGYVKSKGGQKLCKEMTTDPNSLRIHWGSQHNVDGLTFSPIQLDIEDTSHFVCSSTNPPCPYRSLTVGPMRLHWDKEHADQGNKFKVVYNEVKAILPAAPVVTESTKPVADLTTITATEAESVAASSEFSKTETEAIDESPMIPVGRKVKIAPPLPPGAVQRCGFVGCSFESESRRDLARHRKSVGHSKVTTPGGTGDVGEPSYECGHDGCGYRARGIRGIEHHMELSHGAVPEEDWNYKEVGSNKRQRSPSPAPGPSTTLPPQENLTPAISSPPAKQARKAVECDVSANFDMTGLLGEGTESTGDDSDSDFDLDYTVTPI